MITSHKPFTVTMTALTLACAGVLLAGGRNAPSQTPSASAPVAAVMPSAIDGDFAGVAMNTTTRQTFPERR